jgi:hypothetical protein
MRGILIIGLAAVGLPVVIRLLLEFEKNHLSGSGKSDKVLTAK